MKKLIFRAPVATASGYGVHSRMILKSLIESGEFDITIISVPWGATPLIYDSDPFFDKITELSKKFDPKKPLDYDVSIQVTIPNEFAKLARKNIGITAGIEVDRVSPDWIVKTNECIDYLFVPSEHSARTFKETTYTDQSGKVLKLERPIIVMPEWPDASVFNATSSIEEDASIAAKNDWSFPSKFNFLSVGLGLDRADGEDRKNFSSLIRWFCEQFSGNEDVGLVLKLGIVNHSPVDFHNTKQRIELIKHQAGVGKFPRIHLIHGRLSDREMAALYRHQSVKALVTLTHGEGYGLPIIEAAACGLPVVATDWSGHLDFLTVDGQKKFVPVDFELKEIPDSAVWKGVMEKGSRWACPIEKDAKFKMAKVVASYDKPLQWAGELVDHVKRLYNEEIGKKFVSELVRMVDDSTGKVVQPSQPQVNQVAAQFLGAVENRRIYYRGGLKQKNLLYVMPESAGDVYVSTAVVNSLKKKFPDHLIYFATRPQFSDILRGNPDIFAVVHYEDYMQDTRFLEFIFDEVYTPNFPVQTGTNNWIMNGKGRKLAEQFANHCLVEVGDYYIERDDPALIKGATGEPLSQIKYIAFAPGAGSGKWSARNYKHWQTVVDGVKMVTDLPILQIGTENEPLYDGVVDCRGKTKNYNELAYVIEHAQLLFGIDSVQMHLAAGLGTPTINLFGSSHAGSTGPTKPKALAVLLETANRYTCTKACYLNQCVVDPTNPCVNEIPPLQVVQIVKKTLNKEQI